MAAKTTVRGYTHLKVDATRDQAKNAFADQPAPRAVVIKAGAGEPLPTPAEVVKHYNGKYRNHKRLYLEHLRARRMPGIDVGFGIYAFCGEAFLAAWADYRASQQPQARPCEIPDCGRDAEHETVAGWLCATCAAEFGLDVGNPDSRAA